MIGSKATYNPINLLYQYRVLITFCFLLFLFAKPLINNSVVTEDIKYELIETSDKENSSESESVGDLEDENPYFYSRNTNFQLNLYQSLSYHEIGQSFLNYNQDIQLPPPRV